jgi:hypothetical protein
MPLCAYLPVPVRAAVIGLGTALVDTCSVPFRTPVAVGLNATSIVHDVAAANVPVQVLEEIAKSPAFVPVIVIPLIVIDVFSRFLKVSIFAAVVTPTVVFA